MLDRLLDSDFIRFFFPKILLDRPKSESRYWKENKAVVTGQIQDQMVAHWHYLANMDLKPKDSTETPKENGENLK